MVTVLRCPSEVLQSATVTGYFGRSSRVANLPGTATTGLRGPAAIGIEVLQAVMVQQTALPYSCTGLGSTAAPSG